MLRWPRLVTEGSWVLGGQVAVFISSMLLLRVTTARLSAPEYGRFALGLTIVTLVNQIVMGSLAAGVGRFYSSAAEKSNLPRFVDATRKLTYTGVLGVVILGLIALFALHAVGNHEWVGLTAAALLLAIVGGCNSVLTALQNAARNRRLVAFHTTSEAWLKIIFTIVLLTYFTRTATSSLIAYCLAATVVLFSQWWFVARPFKGEAGWSSEAVHWARKIVKYSWPIAASGLFTWSYFASQRWALTLYCTETDVGKFYALTQVGYAPITMAGGLFMSFINPILFSKAGDGNEDARRNEVNKLVLKLSAGGMAFTCLLTVAAYCFGQHVFSFLVSQNENYAIADKFIPLAVLAAGMLQVSISLLSIVSISNRTQLIFMMNVVVNGGAAVLNLQMTKVWGMEGLMVALVIGSAFHLLWSIGLVRKLLLRKVPTNTETTAKF